MKIRQACVTWLFAAVGACGGAATVPGPGAPGVPAPDPTPQLSGPAVASAAAPPAPDTLPQPSDSCFVTVTPRRTAEKAGRKKEEWTAVGTIAVTMRDHKPVAMELRDGAGKVVAKGEGWTNPTEFKDTMRREACRIGGVLIMADDEPPAAGSYSLSVLKPVAPSEPGDLKTLCAGPPPVIAGHPGFDARQARTLALESYETMLTSARWRGWVKGLHAELRRSGDEAAADSTRRSKAAELRAAQKDCWFAGALER